MYAIVILFVLIGSWDTAAEAAYYSTVETGQLPASMQRWKHNLWSYMMMRVSSVRWSPYFTYYCPAHHNEDKLMCSFYGSHSNSALIVSKLQWISTSVKDDGRESRGGDWRWWFNTNSYVDITALKSFSSPLQFAIPCGYVPLHSFGSSALAA